MRILYLANRVPWFGSHSGYERLPSYMQGAGLSSRLYHSRKDLLARAVGRTISLWRGHGRISQSDAAARARLEIGLMLRPNAMGHVLYGDDHLPFWRDAGRRLRNRTVLTLHQPSSEWSEAKAEALSACPHVIVLWQREMDWFRSRLKGGEVHFIPHGVDTEFFTPAPEKPRRAGPLRLLYVGVHLRNFAMLARIIRNLSERRNDLHFDLLVPAHRRYEPELAPLQNHPRVSWHANASDEQLRELYRTACLLLLPMNDSGANTAVVESLACGLPIVTTDVGGIREYGGGTEFPVVENNDDEGMLALIEKYLAQPDWREEVGRRSRAFAESRLAWPIIARRHAELYRKMRA
jgi:glycosyltransferase involved in cell wall biosynthesis